MRLDDIRTLTRAKPFQAFRLYVSNGESFEIHHPDMILATLGSVCVSVPSPGGSDYDAVRILSLYHVQKIEFITESSAH